MVAPSSSAQVLGRPALAVLALLLSLAAVELSFRLVGYGSPVNTEDLVVEWLPGSPFQATADAQLSWSFVPGWQGWQRYRRAADGVEVKRVPVHINRVALRGPELGAAPATRRVLVLGDSVTFGQGVEAHQALPARVARHLDPSGQTEAINAGVPGWNLAQEVRWLELHGAGFHPTQVVQALYLNDFSPTYERPDDMPQIKPTPPWAHREAGLRRLSHVYNVLQRARDRRRKARELMGISPALGDGGSYLDEVRRDLDRTPPEGQLRRLAAACKALAVPCTVALLPNLIPVPDDDGQDILDRLAVAAEAAELPLVRLDHTLDGLALADRYVLPGDHHPSARAHDLLARTLAAELAAGP